ncbi:MAG TPA: recombination mediator RecR [Candidatus Bathyarchaeia archaeon]|nr:recombination mediator RecR [Candidatus Bathyarchaeia archaeon]
MKLPRPLQKLIDSFEQLPGIGPKTASRLAFYLLHVPQSYLDDFARNLKELKTNTVRCSICFNVAESDPCPVCNDQNRNKTLLCVVEAPLDVLALEKTGQFKGLYHVLHGAISPLNNIGPEELYIAQLLERVKEGDFKEIMIATNPNMEGEATAMYISNKISKLKTQISKLKSLKVTRIGLGLPTGADLEYADEVTLTRAIEGRREY